MDRAAAIELLHVPSPQVPLLGFDLVVCIALCDHESFFDEVSEEELREMI